MLLFYKTASSFIASCSYGRRTTNSAQQAKCACAISTSNDLFQLQFHPKAEIMDNIRELLVSQLRCNICNKYLKPPIILCSKGHNCCKECAEKFTTCVVCKYPLLTTRNLALEELAYQVYFECEYCGFVTTCFAIDEHKQNCQANIFKCQIYKCRKEIVGRDLIKTFCKWSGCLDDVYQHFRRIHSNSVYEMKLNVQQEYSWKLPYRQDQLNINVMNMNNVHFLHYIYYNYIEKKLYFAAIKINHNNDNYNFEIHINYGESFIKRQHNIINEFKNLKELMDVNNCIVLHIDDFKNFKDYDRHVYWRLIISQNNY